MRREEGGGKKGGGKKGLERRGVGGGVREDW